MSDEDKSKWHRQTRYLIATNNILSNTQIVASRTDNDKAGAYPSGPPYNTLI